MRPNLAALPPRFLRTKEAAEFLSLSARTLEKHRTYGTGPAYKKLGGRVVYAIDDLQAWVERGAVTSTSDPRGQILPAKRHSVMPEGALIIGIGSTLFSQFTAGFGGATPTIDQAMAIVLAALSLLGLGIFGPGIANGLVAGGPQLGAGSAVGTGLAAGGMVIAGGAALGAAAGGASALAGGAAAAARGGASLAGGAASAYSLGAAGETGAKAVASGLGNVASTGTQTAISPLRRAVSRAAESLKSSYQSSAKAAADVSSGTSAPTSTPAPAAAEPPAVAAASVPPSSNLAQGVQTAAHAVRNGDAHGGGHSVNLSESDE